MAAQSSVTLVGRARHRLRTHVTEHPALYLPLATVKRALRVDVRDLQRQVISSSTELVIEGYTRCGTTFAVYALQLSQGRPVRLAHHWHAPAQLIEASHRKIPALLVIRRLNVRFGTSFAEFVHTEANVRECLELIKLRGTLSKTLFGFESGEVSREQLEREVQSGGGAKLLDARDVWDTKDAWVPSEDRTRAKTALREQWLQQPSLAKLRERAQLVYQAHVDGT